jgi:ergothioneine biosynthesis protein EgtB
LEHIKTDKTFSYLFELGLNHEQQHQELLLTDIKYILGHNPLFPLYSNSIIEYPEINFRGDLLKIDKGNYEVGYRGNGFCFDNELQPHRVWIDDFKIYGNMVTNGEYMEFIEDGGYDNFEHWHSEGWDWVTKNNIKAPLYWHKEENKWMYFTMQGLIPVDTKTELCHISYYEASAFAAWRSMRLPSEFEWEVASEMLPKNRRWVWTSSAYQAYPGFSKASGAVGEYNGKFMVNQMVLRGGSVATPEGHFRETYRNFFHPNERWQYTGIILVK